jgi:protein TonB
MPRDLFGAVSDPSVRVGSRKWYTVPLSLFVHTLVLLLVVVIPLVATGALPDPRSTLPNVVPLVDPIVPPAPPLRRATEPAKPRIDPNVPPSEPPSAITPEPPDGGLETPDAVVDALPGGNAIDGSPDALAPPPAPSTPKPQEPLIVGGRIRPPQRVHYVAPAYPPLAQAARVQGVVIIEATIGVDGRVIDARLLRSIPLLDDAALAAVRQWTYTPTLLNGVAVPVIMTVTVNFQLQPR